MTRRRRNPVCHVMVLGVAVVGLASGHGGRMLCADEPVATSGDTVETVAVEKTAVEPTADEAMAVGERRVHFHRDVRPILNSHCVACHGGVRQAGDLSFVYEDQTMRVVEEGSPDDSELIARVTSDDPDYRMPPPQHGPELSASEIEILRQWIRQGATWQRHWAFQPPQRSRPMRESSSTWPRQPIDHWVLDRLLRENLVPSGSAAPERWLRRVSLDLVGLPPRLDEREAFLSDVAVRGEMAYEHVVDRLLESPHFGERWASMWLDLVRYADSRGLGADGRRSIWKYRDWVLDALNADMPFDQFTIRQLAGDLLPEPSLDDLIATACHRLTQTNEEGGTDDEQFRLEAVLDRVNTTWQTWQGLTFGCTQCHSHPYDPIRHEEYYQSIALFNNTVDCDLSNDDPRLDVPLAHAQYQLAAELDRDIQRLTHQIWQARFRLVDDTSLWQPLRSLIASTNNDTHVDVRTTEAADEFFTVGTVSGDTQIVLQAPLPETLSQLTAIHLQGLPYNVEKAIADSEWGFVLSHVMVELLSAGSDVWSEVPIARVIADEPFPLTDPALSLNAKNSGGYGAYSRINHPRQVGFVLDQPVPIAIGSHVRVKLAHRITETGSFPLVTRRGRLKVTGDERLLDVEHDSSMIDSQTQLAALTERRKKIETVDLPVMRERLPAFARNTYLFERGNFLNKGSLVFGDTPDFLQFDGTEKGPAVDSKSMTRLELARWIADKRNPLTARVAVNRFWEQLFGVGLVATAEDFGSSGEPPSHPELLDDLAVRFAEDMRWSMKSLLRELTLSATYRQTSIVSAEQSAQDPANRLLSRGPRTRLSAEAIRDQALAVSGLLTTSLHGPPVHPPLPPDVWKPFQASDAWTTAGLEDPDRYRRSLYTYIKRSIPFPMYAAFDAPSREFCTPRRLRSNTPLQALMTLNDQSFAEANRALAVRMRGAGEQCDQWVTRGMLLVASRMPKDEELVTLRLVYQQSLHAVRDTPVSAGCETVADASSVDAEAAELLALTNVASVLLNLDEVLCK